MSKVDYIALKKGGFMHQKQKDNFSLRLQVVGGHLSAAELKTISEVADTYGDGFVHLTSRQGVEIPFIKKDDIEAVKEELKKGGLQPGACGASVRTVTACQGNRICKSGNIDTYEIASTLNKRYYGLDLPHKFKIGVTGCQNNCLKAEENDLGIKGGQIVQWIPDACIQCGACVKVCRFKALTMTDGKIVVDQNSCSHCGRCSKSCPTNAWNTKTVYLVSFGGTFGNHIFKGFTPIPPVRNKDQLIKVADAAIDFFRAHGIAKERLVFTIDRVGKESFIKKIEEAYQS